MDRYTVLIDGEAGAYGVVVPDLPGCTAMGETVSEAMIHAAEAARDWALTTRARGGVVPSARSPDDMRRDPEVAAALLQGAALANLAVVLEAGRPVKANLSLDAGVLAAIDATAARLGVTRSSLIEMMAHRSLIGMA